MRFVAARLEKGRYARSLGSIATLPDRPMDRPSAIVRFDFSLRYQAFRQRNERCSLPGRTEPREAARARHGRGEGGGGGGGAGDRASIPMAAVFRVARPCIALGPAYPLVQKRWLEAQAAAAKPLLTPYDLHSSGPSVVSNTTSSGRVPDLPQHSWLGGWGSPHPPVGAPLERSLLLGGYASKKPGARNTFDGALKSDVVEP